MSNLPLILTAIRFFGALSFPFLMIWIDSSLFLAVSYSLLAITDWLDGITARQYGESSLGRLLDPLADKFLVAGPLILLTAFGHSAWYILGAVIFRELLVTTLREYCSEQGISLRVQRIGKLKTVAQMSYCAIMLLWPDLPYEAHLLLDSVVLGITLVSAAWYSILVYRQTTSV